MPTKVCALVCLNPRHDLCALLQRSESPSLKPTWGMRLSTCVVCLNASNSISFSNFQGRNILIFLHSRIKALFSWTLYHLIIHHTIFLPILKFYLHFYCTPLKKESPCLRSQKTIVLRCTSSFRKHCLWLLFTSQLLCFFWRSKINLKMLV